MSEVEKQAKSRTFFLKIAELALPLKNDGRVVVNQVELFFWIARYAIKHHTCHSAATARVVCVELGVPRW